MRSEFIRIYKSVHTWTGIIAGMALFIAFYAGAITIFKAPLARSGEGTSGRAPAILANERQRGGRLGLLVSSIVGPFTGELRASGEVPDIANQNILHRPTVVMTGGDLDCDRLGRGFACGESDRPFLEIVGHHSLDRTA